MELEKQRDDKRQDQIEGKKDELIEEEEARMQQREEKTLFTIPWTLKYN